MRKCLKLGIGVTICPEVAVEADLAKGYLKKLNWSTKDAQIPVIMIWHAEKWCSPLLKQFMKIAKDIIR
jgi:DNA-binding transcriptional LysR family regulator